MAHASQLHAVPEALSDQDAVMIEPTACAVHAALSAGIAAGDLIAVVGAGTLGLTTVAALHRLVRPTTGCTVVVGAKHARQRELATSLGADHVVPPDQLARAVRRRAGSLVVAGRLTEGADVVFDCVGSAASITEALSMVRPRGRVVLVGMPAKVAVDLAPLWHRELTLVGAYAYGREPSPGPGGADRRSFELAIDLVADASLGRLVSALYPLERYEEAWPMPGPPAAGGLSRWPSTSATRKDAHDEPQARIRARRRQRDASHPVLARRAFLAGEAARGQSGDLRARAPRGAVRPAGRHPARAHPPRG
jgi:threonine dehydrogenase-like Zn-dependent dehydrogenase